MTKPKPRCIDHEGNVVVMTDRPVWKLAPCPRPLDAKDRRKLAQGAYNASSGKRMKITLAPEPWQER